MEQQIKKLTIVVNQISTKLEHFQLQSNFDYKQYSDLSLELNQIHAETVLLIQQAINIDVSQLLDKIFYCINNLLIHLIKSKEMQIQQKIQNKTSYIKIVEQCTQCINNKLSNNLLGGVPVSIQNNQNNIKIKQSSQLPWYDQVLQSSLQKKYANKCTSTTEDYYFNCVKVSEEYSDRQQEFENMIQYANESIAIMGEALQNRMISEFKGKGQPEELNKVVQAIKFKKEDLDLIIKNVDQDMLKDKIQNYNNMEEQMKQHIQQIQRMTAEKVFQYCRSMLKVKLKKIKTLQVDQLYRSQTLIKPDECRCQIYIGEIVSLQNKTEQQQNQLNKQQQENKDKERIISGMELQIKLQENQIKQHILEKQEIKQKIDQQINQQRRSNVFQRQNSVLINFSQNDDQQNDQQQTGSMSPNRKMSREDRPQQISRMTRSQVYQPFSLQNQIQQENLNTDQIGDMLKKDKMLERLIILTNALDKVNKDRRLSQLQYVVENKGERQLVDMMDLIKDIEENDLIKETKSFGNSQQDLDDLNSQIHMPKQYHSQHIIENKENSPKQRFQSTRELNSPKTSYLEQIKEIDENKHILLIPIEQDKPIRKNSKNTSQSSFNDSHQALDEESPENKKKPRLKRTQSNAQQVLENKNKVQRTSSIKLKLSRKKSTQNQSNDLLQHPYGAMSTQPANTGSVTDRIPFKVEDQFKFEKIQELEENQNKSTVHNSIHDRTYSNQIQSGMTTQHHTPSNQSKYQKIKTINQNSDNISQKQQSYQKIIADGNLNNIQQRLDIQQTVQNLQLTKFQQLQEQSPECFAIQEENEKLIKNKSVATHNNQSPLKQTQINSNQQTKKEILNLNVNALQEPRKSQASSQTTRVQNTDLEGGEASNRSLRKISRQTKSPELIKANQNEYVQTYKQSLLDRIQQQSDMKPIISSHRSLTSADNQDNKQKQDVYIRDYINKQKEEFERKQKEERVLFDQNLFEIADQQEDLIIQNALSNTKGYMISQDINDSIMKLMYQNLKANGTQITQTMNKFYQKQDESKIDYAEFTNFVTKFQNLHKRCGKDCIHVTRFYMRLGFIPLKYLNKRKAMKLAKPVVLPGFPKVA